MKHRSARQQVRPRRRRIGRIAIAIVAAVAIAAGIGFYDKSSDPGGPLPVRLPTTPQSYLGIYTPGMPGSYAGVTAFAQATGARPDIAMYYSGWYVPFPARFAATVAASGAVPLIQMDPDNISVAAIAAGHYDGYLSAFAEAVRAYRHPVIMSFGHEMNGTWYTWGYGKTPPPVFIAAWRHVVSLFRVLGATNATWLWTVNIINDTHGGQIPRPGPWWPGSKYVNWVGIDGYYLKPSWQFAPLFGPTIAAVHALTSDPILIAETGAVPATGQARKITDLFAGIRAYGLLGLVWFDATDYDHQDFSLSSPAAIAAFRKGASSYVRPGS
jgi:mannan endo-1,4-beta-mannosidase